MKYWVYFIIAGAMLVHPHLWQKLAMLREYLVNPGYKFWTTFNSMDVFDLIFHGGVPIILIVFGLKKKKAQAQNV